MSIEKLRAQGNRALERHEARTRRPAGRAYQIEIPELEGDGVDVLGRVHSISYTGTLSGDGPHLYEHTFEPDAAPILVSDSENGQLFIAGGSYTTSSRGIIDANPPGYPEGFEGEQVNVAQRNPYFKDEVKGLSDEELDRFIQEWREIEYRAHQIRDPKGARESGIAVAVGITEKRNRARKGRGNPASMGEIHERLATFRRHFPYHGDLELIEGQRRTLIGTGRFEIPFRRAERLEKMGLVSKALRFGEPHLELTEKGRISLEESEEAFLENPSSAPNPALSPQQITWLEEGGGAYVGEQADYLLQDINREIARFRGTTSHDEKVHVRDLKAQRDRIDAAWTSWDFPELVDLGLAPRRLLAGQNPRLLPLAKESRKWNGAAARKRLKRWATNGNHVDWDKYAQGFMYRDPAHPDVGYGFKLPFADIVNGKLVAVPHAIEAIHGVLDGARGGVEIPRQDQNRARALVESYYRKMQKPFSGWGKRR